MIINKKSRSSIIIGALILIVLVFYVFSFVKNRIGEPSVSIGTNNQITNKESKSVLCTRTSRLDNAPQYDRALSFIQQRIDENHDGRFTYNTMHLFNYFPSQLVNCIKIVEETPADDKEFEGYFTFNGSDIKRDYYPIVVNSKYKQSDDTMIAFLLSHEITHVEQYIDSVSDKKELSCIDKEVQAFLAQYRFFISVLNHQEESLIFSRISEAKEDAKNPLLKDLLSNRFNGQLLMLGAIIDLRLNTQCKLPEGETFFDRLPDQAYYDCVDKIVPVTLGELIRSDTYYKKQCGL